MTKKEKGRIRKVFIDVKLLEIIILNNFVSDEFLIYFYLSTLSYCQVSEFLNTISQTIQIFFSLFIIRISKFQK